MPNWEPNWRDVVWNHQASSDAIAALHQAADAIEQAAAQRQQAAALATHLWQGVHRQIFDQDLQRIQRTAAELAASYRAAANTIWQASERARQEQEHRIRERERWHREREEEERQAAREEEERRQRESRSATAV